jgi:anti-sigma B factor antagonist
VAELAPEGQGFRVWAVIRTRNEQCIVVFWAADDYSAGTRDTTKVRANVRWQENAMDLNVSKRYAGQVTIVDLEGRIVLGEASAAVRETVMNLLSEGQAKILLNLAKVDYMDSSGLGMLVSAVASVRKAGGDMKLMNLTHKVDDLMEITRLYTVFDIEDDEEKAIKSFEKTTAAGA